MREINTITELEEFINNKAALIYYSSPQCNVCKILKPKLTKLFTSNFPLIKLGYVNIEKLPEASAQNGIFSKPTIVVYFDNKEFLKKSRNINLSVFQSEIERTYSLYFN